MLIFIICTIIFLIHHSEHHVINDHLDSCPRPKQYATHYDYNYTKKWKEFRNINSSVDYFQLGLSWSPTFCSKKKHVKKLFQCQHSFGFIVHGLWGNKLKKEKNSRLSRLNFRNCRNEKQIPIEIIKKYFCIIPSEHLMQSEWEKHGTCYYKNVEDYFGRIQSLYSKIHLPNNINEILNNQTITKRLRREYIRESFMKLNPQLTANQIDIMMVKKGKKLKGVNFCYDLQFNYISCPRNKFIKYS